MNRIFCAIITILSILFSVGCNPKTDNVIRSASISGRLLYSTDGTPLKGGIIVRASDGKTFISDETGSFTINATSGDSLRFSYIGTIAKTLLVSSDNTLITVTLDPYVPGYDEKVVRVKSMYPEMETMLKTFVQGKDARIGIAVIINGTDTVSVNGMEEFPMLSVYKFPQALAVADYSDRHGISPDDTISIYAGDLKPDSWSPMRDKYGSRAITLPLSEIMEYSIEQSDNNACDVLFRLIGGPVYADSLMKSLGYTEIHILNTEEEMHADPHLCYANRTTPLQMAALFDNFYRHGMWHESPIHEAIGTMMIRCSTGNRRLPCPLVASNTVIGHKTGTGDMNSQGRIIGVNDAGYVFLPDDQGYAIAVFIADSGYDMQETERLVADISEIVFKSLKAII